MTEYKEMTPFQGAYGMFAELNRQLDDRYLHGQKIYGLNSEEDYGYSTVSPVVDTEGQLFPILCQTLRMDITHPWAVSSLQRVFQHSNGYDPNRHNPAQLIHSDTGIPQYTLTQGTTMKELAGYMAQFPQKPQASAKIIRGVSVLRPGLPAQLHYHARMNSVQQSEIFTFLPGAIKLNASYPIIPDMSDFRWEEIKNPDYFLSFADPFYIEPVVFLPPPIFLNIEAFMDPYSTRGKLTQCTIKGKTQNKLKLLVEGDRLTVTELKDKKFGQTNTVNLAELRFDPSRFPDLFNLSTLPFMDGIVRYFEDGHEEQEEFVDGQVFT